MDFEATKILELITPAVAVAVLAYLTNFFGKVITDQQPFTDDRKWHVQVAGSVFMLNIIISGTLGIWLANTFTYGVGHWWLHLTTFLVFGVLGSSLLFYNMKISNDIYNFRKESYKKLDDTLGGLVSFYASIGKYIPVGVLPIAVFYFATLEFYSQNLYWIIVTATLGFTMLIWSAFGYSLRKIEEIAPVTIYFSDQTTDPITPARILKVNEDNIRLRVDNKIVILSKDDVLKIEMEIPEKML